MRHDHNGSGLKHLFVMVACCVIPMVLLTAVFVFKVDLGTVGVFALMLLCPLLHIVMMRGMMGHGQGANREPREEEAASISHRRG